MKVIVRTTAPQGTFHRAGRVWTKEGTILAKDDLTAVEWLAVQQEPLLHVGPAPEDAELAAVEAVDLRGRVKAAIGELTPEEFGEDGVPLLDAVRKHLSGADRKVGMKTLAEVWAELKAETAGQ